MQLENTSYLAVEAFDGKLQYLDQIATTERVLDCSDRSEQRAAYLELSAAGLLSRSILFSEGVLYHIHTQTSVGNHGICLIHYIFIRSISTDDTSDQ